jgi:hypothetical protein
MADWWTPKITKETMYNAKMEAGDRISGAHRVNDNCVFNGDGIISNSEKDENFKIGFNYGTYRCDDGNQNAGVLAHLLAPFFGVIMSIYGAFSTLSGSEEEKAKDYKMIGESLSMALYPITSFC